MPTRQTAMRAMNPAFIPRNHRVEAVIEAAVQQGILGPFEELVQVYKTLRGPAEPRSLRSPATAAPSCSKNILWNVMRTTDSAGGSWISKS